MESFGTLRIVIVGHVDHGKSTLIGRLFYDTGSIPEARYREIEATCRAQGREFEFAYLMDALEEERDQNITIDTASTFFRTAKRSYVIIDAPGHVQFLKNMITGAAGADAAILLVDGAEGVREQTRRHAYVLSLLGIRQVLVAVNKLDAVGYDRAVFHSVENDLRAFLHSVGIVPSFVVPISAREGENMARRLGNTPWYGGPTILEALDSFGEEDAAEGLPLRLPVQDVYKWDGRRIYAGRVETGEIRVGDPVVFHPSGKRTRVKSVEIWGKPEARAAKAGACVGVTTEDELFVERGEVVASNESPPRKGRELRASVFWLADTPLRLGGKYTLKLATAEVEATVAAIEERLDSSTLAVTERHASELAATEAGNVVFRLKSELSADPHAENSRMGRFVIEEGVHIGGGGIVRSLADGAGEGRRRIDLGARRVEGDDGNVVDLTAERGSVEFDLDSGFLDALSRGTRVLFRFRDPSHVSPLSLLAYEHSLRFDFSRSGDTVNVILYAPPPSRLPSTGGDDVGDASI